MEASVRTINCPSCGAATPPNKSQCDYCGNYLLHLTPFEKRSHPLAGDAYFHSLKRLYQASLALGLVAAVLIYFVFFNQLSEDELVLISPTWFLLTIFGTGGLYAEKAVRQILAKQAATFHEALLQSVKGLSPILVVAVYMVFLIPILLLGISKRLSSPLLIALLITLIWAVVLYLFLVGIFPSL